MNPDLWKSRFDEYLQLRNYAALTIKGYVAELPHFFRFLESMAVKELAAVTRDVIEEYRTHLFYLEQNGVRLSAGTQCCRLCAIKAFTRFLYRERFLPVDPAADVELPRTPSFTPPVLLSEDEMRRLLETPHTNTMLGVRDRAMLEVLYGTGLRNAELRNLTVDEVDLERKEIRLRRGKGGNGRVVPLGREACEWIAQYLQRVRPNLCRKPGDRLLFLTVRGRLLCSGTLRDIVCEAAERAGIDKHVSPHLLRHCYATHLMAAGAGVRHVQVLLGHQSLRSTQFYTKVEITDLRKIIARYHPRERGPLR